MLAAVLLLGLALAAAAAPARAEVDVSIGSSSLKIRAAVTTSPEKHILVIEPYTDVTRTGFRVRPQSGTSSAGIRTSDPVCFPNLAFNDVVCNRFRTDVDIDLGPLPGDAGGSDDKVFLREVQLNWSGPFGTGCLGRADVTNVTALMRLGGGDDRFRVVSAESDCNDFATVLKRPYGMDVSELEIYGNAGDDDIEGFKDRDTLNGGDGRDVLSGKSDKDVLIGGAGNDELDGGSGNDSIAGDAGVDEIRGGSGNDSIQTLDGEADAVSCGSGTDLSTADLPDSVASDCETVDRMPVDDGVPGRVTGSVLQVAANGAATLQFLCPPGAKVACSGHLVVTAVGSTAALAQADYGVPLGATRAVAVRLLGRIPATVRVTATEQGISQKGPRTSIRTLSVQA